MKTFVPLIALVLALTAETVFFNVRPAMAGNVAVMNIEVHPMIACPGKRC